jgi:hypothetical protein
MRLIRRGAAHRFDYLERAPRPLASGGKAGAAPSMRSRCRAHSAAKKQRDEAAFLDVERPVDAHG